ncbi:hypothetical protein ACFQS1_08590 [Paractinoplanes rhizophilus]|uniref:Type III secretion system (T3SS) SseB-like protein n=1 Tax=Paractinoplanes rhizophilus TaxID=1416877 RepID=A0ABW2HQE5_9ACTN|nr:hypothetical protein [Actinoplanes sp.]
MAQWAVIIPADQWATERLYHNETVTVPGGAGAVAPDDEVLLVADDHVVALTRAAKTSDGADLVLTYVRRSFDDPVPAPSLVAGGGAVPDPAAAPGVAAGGRSVRAPGLVAGGGPVQVEPQEFRRLAAALGGEPGPGTPTWLVSLALPIEATTPADAVRQFWTHVAELGPKELPTYVWPSGDELAMQAFVLGEEANQDPEEDDDED